MLTRKTAGNAVSKGGRVSSDMAARIGSAPGTVNRAAAPRRAAAAGAPAGPATYLVIMRAAIASPRRPAPAGGQAGTGAAADAPACPACGAIAWSARLPWTSLRSCSGCGAVLNDRSPSRRVEEERYRDAARASEGGGDARATAHWRLARRLAAGAGGAPRAVLDVGCGAGAFLAAARRDGARVAGVEIDPRAAAAAGALDIEVVPGSILDVAPPAGPWDLVTFWDVLDQVDDPLGALRAVGPHLAPGGLVLARGRNGALHAAVKRAALRVRGVVPWFPDPAVVHRWGFGRRAWRAVLGRAGLHEIVVRPAGPGIGWLTASMLATGRRPGWRHPV